MLILWISPQIRTNTWLWGTRITAIGIIKYSNLLSTGIFQTTPKTQNLITFVSWCNCCAFINLISIWRSALIRTVTGSQLVTSHFSQDFAALRYCLCNTWFKIVFILEHVKTWDLYAVFLSCTKLLLKSKCFFESIIFIEAKLIFNLF